MKPKISQIWALQSILHSSDGGDEAAVLGFRSLTHWTYCEQVPAVYHDISLPIYSIKCLYKAMTRQKNENMQWHK